MTKDDIVVTEPEIVQLIKSKNFKNFKENSLFQEAKLKIEHDIDCVLKKLNKISNNPSCPFSYDLYLVGGSLRDLILNPLLIKDLDIMVVPSLKVDYEDKLNKKIREGMCEDEGAILKNFMMDIMPENVADEYINVLGINTKFKINQLISVVGSYYLTKSDFGYEKEVFWDIAKHDFSIEEDDYNFDSIVNGIKLKSKDLNYSIDLLCVQRMDPLTFVNKFDYNICKVVTKRLMYKKELEYFDFDIGFLKDVQNKELTMDINIYPADFANASFKKHFISIKHKYPDYKLKVIDGGYKSVNRQTREECEKIGKEIEEKIEFELKLKDRLKINQNIKSKKI